MAWENDAFVESISSYFSMKSNKTSTVSLFTQFLTHMLVCINSHFCGLSFEQVDYGKEET